MVLATGFVAMDECAHRRRDLFDGAIVENPTAEGYRVAAHVEQDSATGTPHVPEPGRVRSAVLLALFNQKDIAQCSLFDEALGADVLGGEEEFFGVHHFHPSLASGSDDGVGVLQGEAERLLADDVLTGARGVDADLCVKVVRYADRDHIEIVELEELVIITEMAGNAELIGQRATSLRAGRGDGDDLRVGNIGERLGMEMTDEAGANDPDLHSFSTCHASHPP